MHSSTRPIRDLPQEVLRRMHGPSVTLSLRALKCSALSRSPRTLASTVSDLLVRKKTFAKIQKSISFLKRFNYVEPVRLHHVFLEKYKILWHLKACKKNCRFPTGGAACQSINSVLAAGM